MSLARLVVAGVLLEGRTRSEVAREYRVSRRWVQKLLARFQAEGEAGLEPRSRRPGSSPSRTTVEVENEIVELRRAWPEHAWTLARPRSRCIWPAGTGPRRRSRPSGRC